MNPLYRKFALPAFAALSTFWLATASAAEATPPTLELWPKGAPGALGTSDEDKPAITVFLPPAGKATGAAVLVCPGGGFTTRCADFEGVLVAKWLNDHGIAGFVLRYRIHPIYGNRDALLDAQRGMQYIRAHAADFRISPSRVGMIGFSAGAELEAMAGNQTLPGRPDSDDPVERQPSRANFIILCYGSTAYRAPADAAGGEQTPWPPTFFYCTAEDTSHLNGMVSLYGALLRARTPVEAHFFVSGEHGTGMAEGYPALGEWPDLMYNWLRGSGFLTDEKRVAVHGVVKLDGQPLPRGSIILTPVDAVGAPAVVGYIFNTGQVMGEYTVTANHGPVAGRYRAEVRQDATRWQSNANNPVLIKYSAMQRNGTLTDEARAEWYAATRQRDLSPSIEGQRVYGHIHPGDKDDIIVEIKPGAANQYDLEVFSK